MDLLELFLLLCMAASLPVATSMNRSTWNPYSGSHHSQSQPMEEEAELNLSSMDAHDERDVHALLSFRNSITLDPFGRLSSWTAENSEKICSWYGIRCRLHTTRVVSVDLSINPPVSRLGGRFKEFQLWRYVRVAHTGTNGKQAPRFWFTKITVCKVKSIHQLREHGSKVVAPWCSHWLTNAARSSFQSSL